jgi:hypothetical protein
MRGRDDKRRRKERQQLQQKQAPQQPQRTADDRAALDKLIAALAGARSNDANKQQ